jgi:hypothetical protein
LGVDELLTQAVLTLTRLRALSSHASLIVSAGLDVWEVAALAFDVYGSGMCHTSGVANRGSALQILRFQHWLLQGSAALMLETYWIHYSGVCKVSTVHCICFVLP